MKTNLSTRISGITLYAIGAILLAIIASGRISPAQIIINQPSGINLIIGILIGPAALLLVFVGMFLVYAATLGMSSGKAFLNINKLNLLKSRFFQINIVIFTFIWFWLKFSHT